MSDTTLTGAATSRSDETVDTEQIDGERPTLAQKIVDEARGERASAAASTASGRTMPHLGGPRWLGQSHRAHDDDTQRGEQLAKARGTHAWSQLMRCFPRWRTVHVHLRPGAVERLAENVPVDPNAAATWWSESAHAYSILRRHGLTTDITARLTLQAIGALISGQRAADLAAEIDWTVLHTPVSGLDEPLRRAHATLPINFDDPAVWTHREDKRKAAARKLGLAEWQADDLSRWALDSPGDFNADDLRSWRIASKTWHELADALLAPVEHVERPVAAFVIPDHRGGGWRLTPVLSIELIRLVASLGGAVDRALRKATLPAAQIPVFLKAVNQHTLHAGPRENVDKAGENSQALARALGVTVNAGLPNDKRDRWGRLALERTRYMASQWDVDNGRAAKVGDPMGDLTVRVFTIPAKGYTQRRLGNVPHNSYVHPQPSAAMDLGEAVQVAVERGLPLLLSTEAAGYLAGTVRVGRMKGKPGTVTITSSDGLSATTRHVVAEQAVAELRTLKREGATVTLDAGARQVLAMTLAKPLTDDPVLFPGKQQEVAAIMVAGSTVNASQTGCGKTVMTGRALYHRAASTSRFRALIVCEGRLTGQWRDELTCGAPARGLPALLPNARVEIICDRTPVAAQIRRLDRDAGDEALVLLVPNSVLDRYFVDLKVIRYHLLVADEVHRYVNPATEAHRALNSLRLEACADCWMLSATPKGKTAETLDVLVGIAVGDEAMIEERLNTREAGDLTDEITAHRLRVNYGPTLVRVTKKDLDGFVPKVRPAQPLAIDADTALAELLQAIREGGRDAYRRLLSVLRELKTLEKGSELYKQALVEMSRAQATVLGNVNVFVDASVDPQTLMHSKAALAQALVDKGLVGEAMRGGGDGLPLLRGITAQAIQNSVADEQVLVFAERVWCLRNLARTLNERFGVRAYVADGSLTEAQFDELKRAFQAGEFPVLCLSKIGQEGHNLQNASLLVHLDMPWTHIPLEQRVGRADRPGSVHEYVSTYIPYIKAGGIEHVISVLAGRGAENHQILDSFEGVQAVDSTIANQLGAITAQVADSKDEAGFKATAARLRVAGAVFGV